MDAGLWIPRKLRPPKIQQPRARRACFGELIQIDGCEHRWFEERAPMCTAIVYVDDATSRLMVVRFAGSESTFAYFEATLEYLKSFGKPLAFYSDKASIFRINQPGAVTGPGYTQFGRALYELNIDGICANTAAAKGRVERAHLTLQDRGKGVPARRHLEHRGSQRFHAALYKRLQQALLEGTPQQPQRAPSYQTRRRSGFHFQLARAAQGDQGAHASL